MSLQRDSIPKVAPLIATAGSSVDIEPAHTSVIAVTLLFHEGTLQWNNYSTNRSALIRLIVIVNSQKGLNKCLGMILRTRPIFLIKIFRVSIPPCLSLRYVGRRMEAEGPNEVEKGRKIQERKARLDYRKVNMTYRTYLSLYNTLMVIAV